MRESKSIRRKLLEIFLLVVAVVFIVNIYIYFRLNKTIVKIDNVYSSNIRLNQLSKNLTGLEDMLGQYLNTKSSESLEHYYMYEQEYRDMLNDLNNKTVNNPIKLAEKNIYNISLTWLEKTNEAVAAKRGRNVARYNGLYQEAEQLYDYLMTSIHSNNTTVFLKNSQNYSLLRTSLNYVVIISIALMGVVVLVAALWTIVMTRSITRPLVVLADVANEIARGNMEVTFPIVKTKDEISTVAKACNKMLDSIREYIRTTKENYERENSLKENELVMKNDLKEAQLKYLQAQINPHFLFNSLNAGAQLAMMEGAEQACSFIQNMADFFRYNVRMMDKETTLREELKLIDNYVYILNVRFSGEIHYYRQTDERLLDIPMPSMILQPIIENCVNHGIRGMEGKGKIHLSVCSERENISIMIADNGTGIAPEKAEKIIKGESTHSSYERDSAGIGLDNVINRLRSYYNTEKVFYIGPGAQGGTEVTISIPKEACREKHFVPGFVSDFPGTFREGGGSDGKDINL